MSNLNASATIQELRNKGYVVRVHHVREFPFVASVTNEGYDNMLTRGEFERAVDNCSLKFMDNYTGNVYPAEGDETVFGNMVSPVGGFTKVDIYNKQGVVVASGKRNFTNQQFNKRVGLISALGKALTKLS